VRLDTWCSVLSEERELTGGAREAGGEGASEVTLSREMSLFPASDGNLRYETHRDVKRTVRPNHEVSLA